MHRKMFMNPRYGVAGMVAMPAVLLFEILGPIIELSGYAFAIYAFATGGIALPIFLLFLSVSVLYGLILSFGAIALEDASFGRHPGWDQLGKILLYAVLENLGYRQISHVWKMEGIWDVIHGGEWGAMERKGLGTAEPVSEQVGLR